MYVDAAYWYRPSSVVCRSVTLVSPAKNGWTDRDAIWVKDSGGPRESCIRWGSRSPHGKGHFLEGKERPIVKYRDTTVISAKMAEPIEMLFGSWARMGPRNHVLDWSLQVLRDVATATNFWLSKGYNFGCMIASDTPFDSRGWFSRSSYPTKT